MSVYLINVYVIVLLMLHFIPSTAVGKEQQERIAIEWHQPVRFPVGEDDYLEVLYFESAVFTDSMPTLPVYKLRIPNTVPHFSWHAGIADPEFGPVSPAEEAVLRAAGFREETPGLEHQIQVAGGLRSSVISFYPYRYLPSEDRYEKVRSFMLETYQEFDQAALPSPGKQWAGSSVLSAGNWYRICVEETGVHRLGYDELLSLGMDPSTLQRQQIRLYGNGSGMLPEANNAFAWNDLQENAIYVSGNAQGNFGPGDYLLFYGRSPDLWDYEEALGRFVHQTHLYANRSCYFITADRGPGRRIQSRPVYEQPATHQVTTFRDYAIHQLNQHNLIGSGRQWYGEIFDATTTRQFHFDLPGLEPGKKATAEAYLAARAPVPSSFTLTGGGRSKQMNILSINPADYNGFHARSVNDTMEFTPSGQERISLTLTYNRPGAGTRGWLNYLVINASRQLSLTGPQMGFRDVENTGPGHVLNYTLEQAGSQVRIWDVTDRFHVVEQEVVREGNRLSFRLPGDELREMLAFDGTDYLLPSLEGRVGNQDLHAMEPRDMIIVTAPELLPEAERLAAFRREHDGIRVGVVTTEQVYNEFSSGSVDISAIRNFMKMFYDRAQTPGQLPRYLLLFGNGTIDNRDRLGFGGNLIPTYQSEASLSFRNSYMTDDYFGLLDDHEGEGAFGVLDIGIGRLPVRTVAEASALVDKIIRYQKRIPGLEPGAASPAPGAGVSNYADWRNTVVFIADDGDFNVHLDHAEILSSALTNAHPEYNVEKIYLDAYQQLTTAGGARYPEVNRAINERVNKGALLINYIGHGGTRGLAHQRVLTMEDVGSWNNTYNMPVFMTATCEFSSFDQPDPNDLSAGVSIVLKPLGGTMAMYTTTRLAWSGSNLVLNRNFMNIAFARDDEGQHHRLGDLIRIAKQRSSGASTPMQLRNFVLLGDPSMRMAYPRHRVVTDMMPDTIRAFQRVEVSGHVTDAAGNKLDGYQGVVFPTVYDKTTVFRTLGNNPGSIPGNFEMRNAVLYRGQARVEDGEFSFSFVMPKDIAYQYGSGKISYYLDDGHTDGHGEFRGFVIGGTLEGFEPDQRGPEISLFMNDTTFRTGDTTNENPVLLAFLSDENGINVTGRIGHDIVAILNGNTSAPIRLNSYYQADLDSYNSGRLSYPFFGLPDGEHQLTLRAWDIHNNPSEASLHFVVASSDRLILGQLMNYPNPFDSDTWFTFSHNQPSTLVDVHIDIYDLSGRLVRRLFRQVSSGGYQSEPIHWDGRGDGGKPLGSGVYLYRLRLETPDGQKSGQTQKLVIMR